MLSAGHDVSPLIDNMASGATPPSSISDTLAFAPAAAAILFRSVVRAATAAVRTTGVGLGLGEGLGSGLGLNVTDATGVWDGVP